MAKRTVTTQNMGNTAPPINPEKLDQYEQLAKDWHDKKASSYMLDLVKMVRVFFETPESTEPPRANPFGQETPLTNDEINRIWDYVPWSEECDLMGRVFKTIQQEETVDNANRIMAWRTAVTADLAEKGWSGQELEVERWKHFNSEQYDGIPFPVRKNTATRDAADHLLWYARELTKDREPRTKDKHG